MAEPIIGAFPVKYTGLFSDDHLIDRQEFGASLQGLAKISNSAVDFYLHGKIAKPRQYQVRLFAAPAEPRCVLLEIVGLMAAGQLPLYAPVLCHMTTEYLVPLIKAMIFKRLKRPDLMEKALNQLQEVTAQNHEFAKLVHGGQQQDKAWMQAHIDKLSAQNAGAFRQRVSPVGSTCSLIQIGTQEDSGPLMITEAEADVLTSREELVVEDEEISRGFQCRRSNKWHL